MGMNTHIYLGPYLVCKNPQIPKDYTIRACGTKGCKSFMKATQVKFCSDCGAAVGQQTKKGFEPKIDDDAVRESIHENLTIATDCVTDVKKGFDVWLPNITTGCPREFDLHDLEASLVPLAESDRTKDLEWFSKFFAKEIETIRITYGEESCEVGWGVVVHTF